ncbi:MAG TPA: hypothetical protein VHG08_01835 [Longimicrobium sp.]|nr:hypothetical protein [Longimicrobium sp.]
MKKLKLDIELLQVDTFDTHPNGVSAEGTVRGNQFTDLCQPATQYCHSGQATCDTCNSCQNSTAVGDCFCTECVTCWNCADA